MAALVDGGDLHGQQPLQEPLVGEAGGPGVVQLGGEGLTAAVMRRKPRWARRRW